MSLVGGAEPSAAGELGGDDADDEREIDADDEDESPAEPAPAAPSQPRGNSRVPSGRGAAACNAMCRQLQPGEHLMVERLSGPGGRQFLCTLEVPGPLAFPRELQDLVAQQGYAATGELELVLCNPQTGDPIYRAITPPLAALPRGAHVMGAFGAPPAAPPAPAMQPQHAGAPGPADILSVCLQGMNTVTSSLAGALGQVQRGAPGRGSNDEVLELYKMQLAEARREVAELRARFDELASRGGGGSDDDDDDDHVSRTVRDANALVQAGFVSRDTAAAVANPPGEAATWAGLVQVVAPELLKLGQQIAHEVGEVTRMRLAFEAERNGLKLKATPLPSSTVPSAVAGAGASGGQGAGGAT